VQHVNTHVATPKGKEQQSLKKKVILSRCTCKRMASVAGLEEKERRRGKEKQRKSSSSFATISWLAYKIATVAKTPISEKVAVYLEIYYTFEKSSQTTD